jgi:hypothetical protein
MARLNVDSLHSVAVERDRLVMLLRVANQGYEVSLDRIAVSLLIPQLQMAATKLPAPDQKSMLIAMGFQPVRTDQGQLGIEVQLSEQLSIPLILGNAGLEALRACIDQLLPPESPAKMTAH